MIASPERGPGASPPGQLRGSGALYGRLAPPLIAALTGLAGTLAVTMTLYASALNTLDRVLNERLRGAGESAASLLGTSGIAINSAAMVGIMRANGLESAYVLDGRLRVLADATGSSGRRADLLRVDVSRVQEALRGRATVGPGYAIDTVQVLTGYFAISASDQSRDRVLVLEAGEPFVAGRASMRRARDLGVVLSVLCGLGLAMIARRSLASERRAREAAARAARGEAVSRVAAMAAHEIRNPLGVIRGTIDLMRERSLHSLTDRDRRALDDVIQEVERLRRLTQDLLDLGAERPLAFVQCSVGSILEEAVRATEANHPGTNVALELAGLPSIDADPVRLRQVFTNLLENAAHAQGEGAISVVGIATGTRIVVDVRDRGPGIPADQAPRLFDLYFTTKSAGTGLGLAVARRFVEQHGGTLVYVPDATPGALFRVTLPILAAAQRSASS